MAIGEERKLRKLLSKAEITLDEEPREAVVGTYKTKSFGESTIRDGILIATDTKIFFYGKRSFGNFDTESFNYSKISSFETGRRLLGHYFSFFASGNKVRIEWIQKGDVNGFFNFVRNKISESSANVSLQKETKESKEADQIREFKKLFDEGIITEEEFNEKKKQILNI